MGPGVAMQFGDAWARFSIISYHEPCNNMIQTFQCDRDLEMCTERYGGDAEEGSKEEREVQGLDSQ